MPRKKTVVVEPSMRSFGNVRKLRSGRWQARYAPPGGTRRAGLVPAPETFDTKEDAESWLAIKRVELVRGIFQPTSTSTLREYVPQWLNGRPKPLKQRTIDGYWDLLDKYILTAPAIADRPMGKIRPDVVRAWYANLPKGKETTRAHAYSLLKSIFKTAAADELIDANPCRIVGATVSKRKSKTVPATLQELEVIVANLPARYKLMILLAAWCAMRFGELAELRAFDFVLKKDNAMIKVTRAVVLVNGEPEMVTPDSLDEEGRLRTRVHLVGTPKTEAGIRTIDIPPHLVPLVRAHIATYCTGLDSLLFPSAHDPQKHMRTATLYKVYYRARKLGGRPDLRFHDLRHTGAVLFAQTGATLADLMDRLGHTTPAAAMRYQHAVRERQVELTAKLSEMAAAAQVGGGAIAMPEV